MRCHIGGLVGLLALLAFFPLTCTQPTRPPAVPAGTQVDPAPPEIVIRPVRVLLQSDVETAHVAVAGPCEVRNPVNGETLDRLPVLASSSVRCRPGGFEIGPRTYVGATIDLAPTAGAVVAVENKRCRGALRLVRRPGNRFHVINVVPMEQYLASVMAGEMPASWPEEALKAQIVAARTYAVYQAAHRSPAALFDVQADTRSQVYPGLSSETARSRRLVAETAGVVLTCAGRLLCTYYSSTCGGHTQDVRHVFTTPAVPPLAGVPCPYCTSSKYYHWNRTLDMATISEGIGAALARGGKTVGSVTSLQVLERAASGHIARIRVVGTEGTAELTGKAFRHALGTAVIRSTRFQMEPAAKAIRFSGRGFGHGVGMCQVGAKGAAEAGLDFMAILRYYYPHSTPVRAATPGAQDAAGRAASTRSR